MRVLAGLTLALVALASPGAMAQPKTPFEVGQPFPEIRLPSLDDGKLVSIADFRGEKVILQIFASW